MNYGYARMIKALDPLQGVFIISIRVKKNAKCCKRNAVKGARLGPRVCSLFIMLDILLWNPESR